MPTPAGAIKRAKPHKKKSKMIKSLRKIAGAGSNSNAPTSTCTSLRNSKAGGVGLEEDDDFQTYQSIPTPPGRALLAIDHVNVPSLRPGAPTDLHQAVLSHDWDVLRSSLGILDLDDALSITSQGAENGGDIPNKGDGVGLRPVDFSADGGGKQHPPQQAGPGKKGGGAAVTGTSSSTSSLSSSNRQSLLRGRRNKKSSSSGISDGSPSGRNLLAPPPLASSIVGSASSPSVYISQPIKRQYCLSRDEGGRTPLHLILLRYTGGSLKKRTLRLRRAPDDVILGLIQLDPRAGGVPDREGMRPLHVAAREGHSIGVIDALLKSFPGSAAERDGSDKSPLDYALEYACQNARKKKSFDPAGGGSEDGRWLVVKRLLQASSEAAATASSISQHQSQENSNQKKINPPLLLMALSKAAPESVVRILIPSAAPYFSSRHGVNDACTALYLAIANRYSLNLMRELESVCPSQTRSVRDETGMGLVAASYVVWAYGEGSKSGDGCITSSPEGGEKHWTKLKNHRDMMLSITKARVESSPGDSDLSPTGDKSVNDGTVPRDFHEWWCKTKFWILHYRPESTFPATPRTCTDSIMRADAADESDHLLHAALMNPDTPSQVVYLILRLHPSLGSAPSKINQRLPLHISVVTPCYTARHYEEQPLPYSTIELVYRWHPQAISVRDPISGQLPLHLAIWEGRKTWNEGVGVLARAERRALRVRDWSLPGGTDSTNECRPTGLYPFQMAAVGRPLTDQMKIRFAYMARNCHTNAKWRGMLIQQRAAEVAQIQAAYDLEVVATVFELLRADPGVICHSKDAGGSNVKLLAMRWGARARSSSNDVPHSAPKTATQNGAITVHMFNDETGDNGDLAPSLPPPLTSIQRDMGEVPDMFASPRSLNTEFTDDSCDPATISHALQFIVEEGEGKVTTMSPSPCVDEINASLQQQQQEQQQRPTIEMPVPTQSSTPNHATSPDAVDSVDASPAGTLLLSPDWLGTALGSPASDEHSTTSASSSDLVPPGYFEAARGADGTLQKDFNTERCKELSSSGGKNSKKSWFKGVRTFKSRRLNDSCDFNEIVTEEEKISNMLDSSYASTLTCTMAEMKGVPQQLTAIPSDEEEYWFVSDPSFSPSSQDRETFQSSPKKSSWDRSGWPRLAGGRTTVNQVVGKSVKKLIRSESEVEDLIINSSDKNGTFEAAVQWQCHQLGIFHDWMNLYNVDEPGKEMIRFESKNSRSCFFDHAKNNQRAPVEEIALGRPRLETQSTTSPSSETASGITLCLNCNSRRPQMLILPCRHMCLCSTCAREMLGCCPMCQRDMHFTVEVYF